MDNYTLLHEAFVGNMSQHQIQEKSNLTLPIICFFAGAAIMFFQLPAGINLHWFLMPFLGLALITFGIIKFVRTPKHQYTPSKKPVHLTRRYFHGADKDYIINCLTKGEVKPGYTFSTGESSSVLLEAYTEKDGNFLAAQVSHYVPYEYHVITEPIFLHGEEAKKITKALAL